MTAKTAYTLGELASTLGLELNGEAETVITGLATLSSAGSEQLSFFHNERYFSDLQKTSAGAVIVHPKQSEHCKMPVLLSDNPYLAYAKASRLFIRKTTAPAGIHASALIHPDANVAASASIGPFVQIGARTVIGENVSIGANTVIDDDCSIGEGAEVSSNVSIYHAVAVGKRARIHASVVIGSDGFGFAPSSQGYHKIEQLGGVRIGDDVEIGAATTIDRGALDDTVIGDGVKIDNQVQIAHNVIIGSNTVICGCSAIAGSSTIGKNCIIAGAVGVINHVSICDGTTVTAMSLVNQSIREPGTYSSGTGLDKAANWKKNIVRFRQLDSIWKKLLRLEKK